MKDLIVLGTMTMTIGAVMICAATLWDHDFTEAVAWFFVACLCPGSMRALWLFLDEREEKEGKP